MVLPARRASWLVGIAAVVSCTPVTPTTPVPGARLAEPIALAKLIGTWRWLLRTDEAGTARIEDERWQLAAVPGNPGELRGTYLRDVEVRSTDRVPFECNQRPWYRQRAVFDVTLTLHGRQVAIHEAGYHTEPSPCDHGFRHLADYTARVVGNRMVVHWDGGGHGGDQTLWQIADTPDASTSPTAAAWAAPPAIAGTWHWESSSYDPTGNVRDEAEQWELTQHDATHLDGTYRRRVTTRSPDRTAIVCAGAPSWSFDDTYVLTGEREEEHWHFYELAVDPGDHPCLRATPKRTLDEATGEQIGDYLILEWRGKRRQVLYRPADAASGVATGAAASSTGARVP